MAWANASDGSRAYGSLLECKRIVVLSCATAEMETAEATGATIEEAQTTD
jgi:hypothetical protein